MKKFYFSTGVDSKTTDHHILGGIDSGNGVICIPFECEDVPEGATFLFACDSPNLRKEEKDIICRRIHNSSLLSEYAYFKIQTT